MQLSPYLEEALLPQQGLDAKYVEFGMSAILNDTAIYSRADITEGIGFSHSGHRRKTDWRWERYFRIADKLTVAIVRWRENAVQESEFHVVQFLGPDRKLYSLKEVGAELLGL